VKLSSIRLLKEVIAYFPYRVRPPVEFHLYTAKGQESITGVLSGYDLHRFGPPPEFFVQSLNDIGGTQGIPFLFSKVEEDQAVFQGVLYALHR